jgi:hypothetical protein
MTEQELMIRAAAGLVLAHAVIDEHENLEDCGPMSSGCGMCNMGTGPHKRTCAYHQAKAIVAKVAGKGQ